VPTSQANGPEIKTEHRARYRKIFNMIQSSVYQGANIINKSQKNKFLRLDKSGKSQLHSRYQSSQGAFPYNSNLLPFNPG